jgi:translation initiation factor IF-2
MYVEQRIVNLKKADINNSIDSQNELRTAHHQNREMVKTGVITKDELAKQLEMTGIRKLPVLSIVLKADVHGSLEAIEGAIQGLPQNKVTVEIVSSGVGTATPSDIELAETTQGSIHSFNYT